MKARVCDICHDVISNNPCDDHDAKIKVRDGYVTTDYWGKYRRAYRKIDLCERCRSNLILWLKAKSKEVTD